MRRDVRYSQETIDSLDCIQFHVNLYKQIYKNHNIKFIKIHNICPYIGMAVYMCVYLLLLLVTVTVFSHCGATEYYVRPTEPTNTSCPAGQSCLTLNHYTSGSNHYFKSNTVFKFLPGTHRINTPLQIRNVHNVSLTAYDDSSDQTPHIMAEFSCENETNGDGVLHEGVYYSYDIHCAAIWFTNVTDAAISGINVTVETQGMSAIVLHNVSGAHIQLNVVCTKEQEIPEQWYDNMFNITQIGILVYESSYVWIDLSIADNCTNGIIMAQGRYHNISNTIATNGKFCGIILYETNNLINNTIIGIRIASSTSTSLMNVSAEHNQGDGILIYSSTSTSLMNVSVEHNQGNGIWIGNSTSTSLMNVSAEHNQGNGIWIGNSTSTSLMNVSVEHSQYDGIWIYYSTSTSLMNVSVEHNQLNGILIFSSTSTSLMNVSAEHNQWNGIFIYNSTSTSLMNVSAEHNQGNGIWIDNSTSTSLMNVSVEHSQYDGISIYYSTSTSLMNVSVEHNQGNGIWIDNSTSTSLMTVSAEHNQYDGKRIESSTSTSLMNVSVQNNQQNGIYFYDSQNVSLHDVISSNNSDGLYLHKSDNITVIRVNVYHNKNHGISLTLINNISITNGILSSIVVYSIASLQVSFCLFSEVDASTTITNTDPDSLPAIIELYDSSLNISECNFTRNNISSVKAFNSSIIVSGDMLFSDNTAISGTVFNLRKRSTLTLQRDAHIFLKNNHATNNGGVFYIATEEIKEKSLTLADVLEENFIGSVIATHTECFLHVEGSKSQKRMEFVNNTAEKGGDVLYGGLVALGWDEDWNCLFTFKNTSDFTEQSSLSLVSSTPSRVCFCNSTGHPDCLTVADPVTHTMYPGQTITIPGVVVGQDFGTVAGLVFAQFVKTAASDSIAIEQEQRITGIGHRSCTNLNYTVFASEEVAKTTLVLTANDRHVSHIMLESDNKLIKKVWNNLTSTPNFRHFASQITGTWENIRNAIRNYSNNGTSTIKDIITFQSDLPLYGNFDYNDFKNKLKYIFPKEFYEYPFYVNISFAPCPVAFTLTTEPHFRCDCNQLLKSLQAVHCHIQDQTITRSGLVWVGRSSSDNETVAAGHDCPFNYCSREEIRVNLSDPDSQCNYNHSGTLCGGCQPGLSLALGSNQCLPCSSKYLSLLISFSLAGVSLVFFIKLLDLTISQGTLNGLIFYANIIKTNEKLFIQANNSPLTVFISWLNLDLGVETCFFDGLTAYSKTWLQFVFPLYIWSIVVLIIILAKYSDRVAKVMGNNSVPILATLFLLSYSKLYRTIIKALNWSTIMISTLQNSEAVWSADGNLEYLGAMHSPLFVAAVGTLLFLWLPYTLLLFLGQWLHRCNSKLIVRMLAMIKPFLDAHYGPLKDNHRYWFGALLLVRATILLLSALIPADRSSVVALSVALSSVVVICFQLLVYRHVAVAIFNASFSVNIAFLCISNLFTTTVAGNDFRSASNTLIGLAFIQFVGLVLFKVFSILKRNEKVIACFRTMCRQMQPPDDDWELYEQAALVREEEARQREERGADCDESSSEHDDCETEPQPVSLPTYGI